MKIDLGVAQITLPSGYTPSVVIASGPEDARKNLSLGPTVVQEQTLRHRRVISINFTAVAADEAPDSALQKGLHDVVTRARAKVTSESAVTLPFGNGRRAEFRHLFNGAPTVTFALLTATPGLVWAVMMTGIDEPQVIGQMRGDFDTLVSGLQPVRK